MYFEPGVREEMSMTWKYDNGEYEVRFVDCAEHVLSDQLGYRHAKCSCAEYLTRRQMPRCHILVLYLLVCNVHDQADTYI